MEIDWDIIISAIILIWLFLAIASRITNQKISEMLSGIRDFVSGTREEVTEKGEELLYYEWRYDRKRSTRNVKRN